MGIQDTIHRTLRSEIEQQIKARGYTLSKLGELTGINPGNLSDMLNRYPHRAITIGQLDAMAAVFNKSPGWLYELYEEECFTQGKVSRPRVVPYLVRCAEVGRQDCIESVVPKILENHKNVTILLAVAEHLFENGMRKESAPFFQYVIDTEKDSHSERYVMALYRLFLALIGTNSEENWKAVIRFDPYRKRLPEQHQLDALLQLANICFTLHKWEEVEKYSDELRELSTAIYQDLLRKKRSNKGGDGLQTERHLVVYFGQGFLLKASALQKQGHYEQAKTYVNGYADLGWFEGLDEIGQAEVQKFKEYAVANSFALDILMGRVEVLAEYVTFLQEHPDELLSGLVTILTSANKHGFSVETLLEQFASEIHQFDEYRNPLDMDRHLRFRYELAIYLIHKGEYPSGVDNILRSLGLARVTNNHQEIISCVTLFETHRHYASDKQKKQYKNMMEVLRNV
ncbi:helix-turn-helix transcriptional regulator [Brevibacillus ruminantium]|uniref:Helix-turn-helix transcriptional regulator n=1 Tax=Brevibacillus ruminantium TaxID=2950604 RepID=A0ABY4W9Q2_9BACL|nr:helix-turn-helix transcriptional regulator [Brevibacillus ruminantium]USG63757.1 helix-turn-helix transcriptional regulator [Brevibacillus ruminantium]